MSLINQYLSNGRVPWSPGYSKYKNKLLQETLADADMMRRFAEGAALPEGFGAHIDERIVEIPWSLAHLAGSHGRVLDAGSVLNVEWLLNQPQLTDREVVIWSLVIDQFYMNRNLSYIHGDFRTPILRSGVFDAIVCISTLEHVGMWPIPSPPFAENLARPQPPKDLQAYRAVVRTFNDLLAPGGRLLLTVPVGLKEDQDWLQIFDKTGVDEVVASFDGRLVSETYYLTSPKGWTVASPEDCAEKRYYNFVKQPDADPDMPAAARAVACLDLRK